MENGDPGVPMAPAVLHVEEEPRPDLDHVTIHRLNMEVSPALDQPQRSLPVLRNIVPLMENGDPGDLMDPALLHVMEEPRPELDHVTIHRHNMEVSPAQD